MGALRFFLIREELDGIADKAGGKKKLKPSKWKINIYKKGSIYYVAI